MPSLIAYALIFLTFGVLGLITLIYILLNRNINIFKIFGDTIRTLPEPAYSNYMEIKEIYPNKTSILRVPEYNYETTIRYYGYLWDGSIDLLDENYETIYYLADKSELTMFDEIQFLDGEDVLIFEVNTLGWKAQNRRKLRSLDLMYKNRLADLEDLMDNTKQTLIKQGEMDREYRRSKNWSNYQEGGDYPSGGYRRPLSSLAPLDYPPSY